MPQGLESPGLEDNTGSETLGKDQERNHSQNMPWGEAPHPDHSQNS